MENYENIYDYINRQKKPKILQTEINYKKYPKIKSTRYYQTIILINILVQLALGTITMTGISLIPDPNVLTNSTTSLNILYNIAGISWLVSFTVLVLQFCAVIVSRENVPLLTTFFFAMMYSFMQDVTFILGPTLLEFIICMTVTGVIVLAIFNIEIYTDFEHLKSTRNYMDFLKNINDIHIDEKFKAEDSVLSIEFYNMVILKSKGLYDYAVENKLDKQLQQMSEYFSKQIMKKYQEQYDAYLESKRAEERKILDDQTKKIDEFDKKFESLVKNDFEIESK